MPPTIPPPRRFKTGARPSPRIKFLTTPRFEPAAAAPTQYYWKPVQLNTWDNSNYGDCVSAEEAFAKAAYPPNVFVEEAEVVRWAREHGVLNGATLTEVLDAMQTDGMQAGGQTYKDGPYKSVEYSTQNVLEAAIAVGPVKIAIDSSALPSNAGNNDGWYATGGGRHTNTDHCVSLSGYGPAGWLYEQLKVFLPAALKPDQRGYTLFTWGTVGFVDHAWLLGTCEEAWLRDPTTVGPGPTPPPPPPPPPAGRITLNVPAFTVTGDLGHLAGAQAMPPWLVLLIESLCSLVGHKPPLPPLSKPD